MEQLEFPRRGGRRPGAGRPKSKTSGMSHLTRQSMRNCPAHVTLKIRHCVGNLRTDKRFRRIQRAFFFACDRFGMSLLQFSVQGNHIHLIVEAVDRHCLAKGIQALCIRIARGINGVSDRRGTVFADRYHAHILTTPTEVRHALHYVLHNQQNHRRKQALSTHAWYIDPFSSASGEACWYVHEVGAAMIVAAPRTWLGKNTC